MTSASFVGRGAAVISGSLTDFRFRLQEPPRYSFSSEGAADATPGHEESGSSILTTCDSCSI